MPRTTLDIDATVLRALRHRGKRERKSMGQIASELLAAAMAENEDAGKSKSFRWISRDMGPPKVDLEDKEALQAVLDERS